jgi:beta-glucanase (GH16 family)
MLSRYVLLLFLVIFQTVFVGKALQCSDHGQLVFRDEFNGESLNTDVWKTVPRWGRFDKKGNELQYYVDDAFEVSGGTLKIKAEKRDVGGFNYTSGLIETRDTFTQQYGYFEMRAKMPEGQGYWPAFWLLSGDDLPSPSVAEIDVFEFLGHETDTIYMSHHWRNLEGERQSFTKRYTRADFSDDLHTFAVKWSPLEIVWCVDGLMRHRTSQGVPSEPLFLIANLAIGGEWPGDPDASTPFPGYLEIDYIRVYEWK